MDRLKQLETFAAAATKGSLTAVANAEGVAPAVIGRRIDALERRLGVKLLLRTTRRLSLTHEGSAFLENCQGLLADWANAEASGGDGHRQRALRLRGARRRPARQQPGQRAPGRQPAPVRGHARLPDAPARRCTRGELARRECMGLNSDASQTRGWAFNIDGDQ